MRYAFLDPVVVQQHMQELVLYYHIFLTAPNVGSKFLNGVFSLYLGNSAESKTKERTSNVSYYTDLQFGMGR